MSCFPQEDPTRRHSNYQRTTCLRCSWHCCCMTRRAAEQADKKETDIKLTAEAILRLPELVTGVIEYRCTCGNRVLIPKHPQLMAAHFADDSVIYARDGNGHFWKPVMTSEGLRRQMI